MLASQRDHYMPLQVIREHLDALDRGLEPPVDRRGAGRAAAGRRTGAPTPCRRPARRRRAARCEAAGVDEALLAALESHGLRRPAARHGTYDADAVVVAQTAGELAAFGIEPRHLRAFRTTADREAGLVEQVVSPLRRQREPEAAGRAEEAAREVAGLCVRLHAALVKAAVGARTPSSMHATCPRRPAPASAPSPRQRGRLAECGSWTSSGCGSRCPPTIRSCCCASATAIGTCRSGSAPPRPARSPSPSRASCRRGR